MPKRKDLILIFLNSLVEPYKSDALILYHKYEKYLKISPSSKKYHSNYPGGAYDHTLNIMICVKEMYYALYNIFEIYYAYKKLKL